MNIVVEQVKVPSFNEFCKLNESESVDAEMTLYSEIASRVNQLKEIYGDKAIGKTGLMKSLMAMNELILTGQKENQPQSKKSQEPAQEPAQPPMQPQKSQETMQPQGLQPQKSQDDTQPIV